MMVFCECVMADEGGVGRGARPQTELRRAFKGFPSQGPKWLVTMSQIVKFIVKLSYSGL